MEIQEGNPVRPGLYVAWVNSNVTHRWAEKIFLTWTGHWAFPLSDQFYRGHVYQWLGPLPALELE